ncbi:DUF389 domain-containing protein [Aquitalea sp. ASV11]|uniref:DUF389 domain-containing protein n=1 Tax=Aquitalea sp. ASV11 TaxID=2795103 RepID=UPI0018ED2CAB|nr:DUF389 domain-containing protein [Aquitalea sp. ASV11]
MLNAKTATKRHRLIQLLTQRFSLLSDKASDQEIERRIRDGVELAGATPWILMFAIFIASVGLNVNSTAVIIGAMLISPLMGPIMGAGLGIAVYDFNLVKRALLNLGIATLISLVVSALYFSVSPLQDAQSELLARTTPNVWDVLIAIFGGLAGIVGITRQEKSNVIPGVAIATALMPPVCTAGYGVATGQWNFVGGALYLYTINCVFIGLATTIGIRLLRLERHGFTDARMAKRVKLSLLAIALSTAIPSTYLAVELVNDEVFKSNAKLFISREFSLQETQVASSKINPATRTIEVALIGAPLSQTSLQSMQGRLAQAKLADTHLVVHQSGDNRIDVTALKSSLLSELYLNGQETLRQKDEQIKKMQQELAVKNLLTEQAASMAAELQAQYPTVTAIIISEGFRFQPDAARAKLLQLTIHSGRRLSDDEKSRIENWFRIRSKTDAVAVNFIEPAARHAVRHKRSKTGKQHSH